MTKEMLTQSNTAMFFNPFSMNIRLLRQLAFLALSVFLSLPARAAQDELAIVREGRSPYVIVHAADAPGSTAPPSQL